MRRSPLSAALLLPLLLTSGLTTACAHQVTEPATTAKIQTASQLADEREPAANSNSELDEPEPEPEPDPALELAVDDPNVITFGDDVDAGPADMIVAPPKREDIPGFALFGTGESASTDGPKLSLPPDAE